MAQFLAYNATGGAVPAEWVTVNSPGPYDGYFMAGNRKGPLAGIWMLYLSEHKPGTHTTGLNQAIVGMGSTPENIDDYPPGSGQYPTLVQYLQLWPVPVWPVPPKQGTAVTPNTWHALQNVTMTLVDNYTYIASVPPPPPATLTIATGTDIHVFSLSELAATNYYYRRSQTTEIIRDLTTNNVYEVERSFFDNIRFGMGP
jgi:hypothetical protein